MSDALTRMRVLRASGYRCGFIDATGRKCGQTAALVAHPKPAPDAAPSIAVCKQHAKAARP